MSRVNQCLATFSSLILSGCLGGYGISNIDKPAPQEYEAWVKPGATQLDIKKALLECGKPSPSPDVWAYQYGLGIKGVEDQLNHQLLTDICMEKSGYAIRWGDSVKKYCSWDRHKHLPACQPGVAIPERSVERRLNSWYCRLKTDLDYCLKHAVVPSACTGKHKDYNKPPPECQP